MIDDLTAPPPTTRGLYPADAGRMLGAAWDIVKVNGAVAVGGVLAMTIASILLNLPISLVEQALRMYGDYLTNQGDAETGLMLSLGALGWQLVTMPIALAIGAFSQLGLARGSHRLVSRDDAGISDFFPFDLRLIAQGAAVQFLLGLIVTAGICLFVVPGIIAALGLSLWPWVMVVERRGIVESLQRSWELTDGHKVNLFLFGLATFVLSLLALIFTCGLGLLLVMPLGTLGLAAFFEGARAEQEGVF